MPPFVAIVLLGPDFEPGCIGMWCGSVGSIPSGWFLCDGTHGTPDLRDKFILGSGLSFSPGNNGGSVNHDHSFTSNGHTHTESAGAGVASGLGIVNVSDSEVVTGTSDSGSSLPPYYSLCYLMKA